MPSEIADRTDLNRFADEAGRPYNAGENPTFTPPETRCPLDDEWGDPPFTLSFDSGGEG